MEDVKAQIAEADLVIADFTNKNPNVYYEAGLADAWKKDWIALAQSTDDLTFDVRHIRCIQYSNTMGADVKLQTALENALSALKYTSDSDTRWRGMALETAASATQTTENPLVVKQRTGQKKRRRTKGSSRGKDANLT
jgi:hypothetical protein